MQEKIILQGVDKNIGAASALLCPSRLCTLPMPALLPLPSSRCATALQGFL